jgi:hypothetical protein
MHRLVQVCTRAHLKVEQVLKTYEARAISRTCRQFPDRDDPLSWPQADSLVPHARVVTGYSGEGSSLEHKLMLMERLGYV